MEDYEISALFQDGKSFIYHLPRNSKVSDLIQLIQFDNNVTIPKDREIAILYLGHFLNPSDNLTTVEENPQFTVNVFYRRPKNFVSYEPETLASDLRGFDRLQRAGYTESQIREFRNTFHNFHHSANQPLNERIDLEEEWLPALFSGGDDPQFFLSAQNLANQNNRVSNDQLMQNTDLENSPDVEVPIYQTQNGNNEDQNASWMPFYIGICFGFLFKLNWYIFVPLFHPNKSILIGYLFGCGLYYLFSELSE